MYQWADLRRRGADGEPLITLDDLALFNEVLIVDNQNRERAQKAADRKRGGK